MAKDEVKVQKESRDESPSAPVQDARAFRAQEEEAELNAFLQPRHNALQTPETVTLEVGATGEQPAGLFAGDVPFEAPKGIQDTVRDEREILDVAPRRVEFDDSDVTDSVMVRLNAIAGRQLTLQKGDGKARSHGFQTLINADTGEQKRLHPGALIPEGRWVNVNYLPEAFLKSLE